MRRHSWLAGMFLLMILAGASAAAVPASHVAALVEREDASALREIGPSVVPEMVRLYKTGDTAQRTRIANLFYQLSWKSPEAAQVMVNDVRTQDQGLRLAVQWALGRVSSHPAVVEILLQNMTLDPNPLFRDKAACALAYDQIHLSEAEKVRIYEGLIRALESEEPQVRAIAIQALHVHTGQTKGFHPIALPEQRSQSIEQWERWLAEYKENL